MGGQRDMLSAKRLAAASCSLNPAIHQYEKIPLKSRSQRNTLRSYFCKSALAAVAAIALAAAPLETRAGTVAGVTDGALSVDKLGAAVYSVPIAVPPGVAGMEPALSVNFRSRVGSNNVMGLGWSIGGLSLIHRCARTPVQDGAKGGIDFDADDRFCLDGQRLVAISGNYGANGTEYRTEVDSFARITSYGTAGTGPESFEVEARDGRIIAYGATTDSRVEVEGGTSVRLWAASRVEDRLGNYMTLHYQKGAADGSYRIERIEYAGNIVVGTLPKSEVRFLHESRPDPRSSYQAGTRIDLVDRLVAIEARTDGALVRAYRFAYDTSPSTSRSRLRSITECAGNGDCLVPITFDWTQPGSLSFVESSTSIDPSSIRFAEGFHFGDWNGDGLDDFMSSELGGDNLWFTNNGALGFVQTNNPVSSISFDGRPYFGDWNGDGVTDFMQYRGRSGEGDNEWFVNDGALGFTKTTNPISRTLIEDPKGLYFGDWNGDGVIDVMWYDSVTGRNHWFTNDGALGFTNTLNPIAQAALTGGTDLRFGDWNTDGITDLIWYDDVSGTNRWFINDGALGFTQTNDVIAPASITAGTGLYFGDWNGDGVLDLMWYDNGSGANRWFVNDGALGFTQTDNPITPATIDVGSGLYFGDWNSDGITDTLWYDGANGTNRWFVNDGALGFAQSDNLIAPSRLDLGKALYFGDWAAKGVTGLLWLRQSSDTLLFTNQIGLDQLVGVTDSLGRQTTITYAPLTDGTVYTKGSGAVLPEVDLADTIYVVKEVSTDDGVGGQARLTYAYEGLRGHIQGRGSLGFARISSTNQQTGITTATDYHQDFPFIGLVAGSETRLADGTLVSRVANSWLSQDLNGGLTTFPFVEQSFAEAFEVNDGPGNSPVVTTTATMDVDDFGNPTLTSAITAGAGPSGPNETFTRTGRNSFTNDTVNWLIGQLRRAEVESELPDLSSETRVTAFDYFAATGLLKQEVIEPGRPSIALTTDYGYDTFGNLTGVTVSGPDITTRSTTVTFSTNGRFPSSVTNALGHAETRLFDARFGTVTSLTGPNDVTTAWSHDGFGRLLTEGRADGTETRWSYDLCVAQCPAGAVYAVTQQDFIVASGTPIGPKSVSYFDVLNRVFSSETQGFDGTKVLADRQFNERGEVVSVSKPHFAGTAAGEIQRSTATYDIIGRTHTITAPDSAQWSATYDGLTVSATNPNTQTEIRTSNAIGQLVRLQDDAGTATTYGYGPFGELELTDVNGNTTTISYDVRGLKKTVNDPDMGLWFYDYNALGELVTQTDSKGQQVILDYDVLGRLVSREEPEGITRWTYDTAAKGKGKLHTVEGLDGFLEVSSYDSLSRPFQTVTTIDAETYTTSVGYDSAGRLDLITYPSGFAVRRAYNSRGYLTSVQEDGGTTVFWQADTINAEGQLTQETLGNGVVSSFAFDPQTSFLQSIRSLKDATTIQDLTYDFDKLGSLKTRSDLLQDREETFLYDNLNRLTAARLADLAAGGAQLSETTYTYDAVGNIQTKSDVGTYAYGDGGAGPHVLTSANGVPYAYDTNGNMVASGDPAGTGGVGGPKASNLVTATALGSGNLVVSGFTVPAAQHRVLLVAVSNEAGTINGVTFGGQPMSRVGQVVNGRSAVELYELRDAGIGAGASTGDIVVQLSGTTAGGTQVTAWTLTGIDQTAAPVVAQASSAGTTETSLSGSITTTAGSSIVVSAFGLGTDATWLPGAGETQVGYGASAGEAAGGASYEVVAAGTHSLGWSGPAAERPSMLLAAYAARSFQTPGELVVENVQGGAGTIANYTVPPGDDRLLLVAVTSAESAPEPTASFGGTPLMRVESDRYSTHHRLTLFQLREALLADGAVTGDITVSDGAAEVLAFTAKGINQSRLATEKATDIGIRRVSRPLRTTANASVVISVLGVNGPFVWSSPNAEETEIGYHVGSSFALGASYEAVPTAGRVTLEWQGNSPERGVMILASYGLAPVTGYIAPTVLGPRTETILGEDDVVVSGYDLPSGKDRVLLVAVANEGGSIDGVTFAGAALSPVATLPNGANTVALYQLREAQIGPGGRNGDLVVQVTGTAGDGLATQVTAVTLSGVDQAATPVIAQASAPGTAEASLGSSVTTTVAQSILVSAFGLGDEITWSPSSGNAVLGYARSGSSAGGLGYRLVGAGVQNLAWSGVMAARPTLILAAYPVAGAAAAAALSPSGRTIEWSSFNKPTLITDVASGNEVGFTYGPDRLRIKQHAVVGASVTDTVYVGGLFEKRSKFGSPAELVHYVRAGGATVAIHTTYDGSPAPGKTRYLHRDHLGSAEAITAEDGSLVDRLSYDPHGKRRLADWQAGTPANPDAETPRGFTGHEHLDGVELVHMNGRVYDPTLGRFVSADPYVQFPDSTQSFNRYAYVLNNPLSYTDPSGFHLGVHGVDPYVYPPLPGSTADQYPEFYGPPDAELNLPEGVTELAYGYDERPGSFSTYMPSIGVFNLITANGDTLYFTKDGANSGFSTFSSPNGGNSATIVAINDPAIIDQCTGDCTSSPSYPASANTALPVTAPGLDDHIPSPGSYGTPRQKSDVERAINRLIPGFMGDMRRIAKNPGKQAMRMLRSLPPVGPLFMATGGASLFSGGARIFGAGSRMAVSVSSRFDELAQFRQSKGLPAAGSTGDDSTAALLEVGDETFKGLNGAFQHTLERVNPITLTHAEANVVQQAVDAGLKGTASVARMFVDRAICVPCGPKSGLRSLARNLGVDELIVYSPQGRQVFTPTK